MKPAATRRILGLLTGAALIIAGSFELVLNRADYESPQIQPFCRAGFCPDQFSPEHVFEIAQKASLGDARGELNDFQRSIRLSPASAYRWADLSEAEFNVRDYTKAEYAVSHALEAGPRSPVVLMRAANLEFEIGNIPNVVRDLKALLSDSGLTAYYESAFFTYSRLDIPIDELLRQGVPQNTAVMSSLLTFWTRIGKADEAIATWNWANQHSLANSESTGSFFDFLLRSNHQELAQQLWTQYVANREPQYRKTNWIYNSNFAKLPIPSPFDWNIVSRQDVEAERTEDAGQPCLRLRFNGEANTDYQQTYQDMVLPPGHYQFSVMLKTEQITSDEGVRLHIFEIPGQTHLNVWTETLVGNNDWKQITASFEVPPNVKAVCVQIARTPSIKFDNKIGGTVWVKDLRLFRQ